MYKKMDRESIYICFDLTTVETSQRNKIDTFCFLPIKTEYIRGF